MHGLQFHVGRDPTGATRVHGNASHQGLTLLGWKLVCHCPAWGAAGGAQVLALPVAVDLNDRAVDLIVDVVPTLLPFGAVGGHLLQGGCAFDVRVDGEADRAEILQVIRVAFGARGPARARVSAVAPESQPAGCGHRRVLLAQAPSCGVAGIGKGSLVLF